MKRAGVVIVTFNSGEVIGRCLDSCAGMPVVVADNASADGTVAAVRSRRGVTLIENSTNRGFGAAVNQGVRALDTEFVLLLNPDAELVSPIEPLEDACERAGLAAGRLVDAGGRTQTGFGVRRLPTPWTLAFEALGINRMLPWNPVNRRYRYLDGDLDVGTEVEQPAGAFLMFRRDVWRKVGGFDPRFYPIWFEDVDFCKRAREAGFRIEYVPQVVARHRGGHSVGKLEWGSREVYWYASLLRYACKHFRPNGLRGVSAAVALGSVLRAVTQMVARRSLEPLKVYAKVARLATPGLLSGRMREWNRCPGSGDAEDNQ
jgi:N-acetylglucosaminyl-diphospho-decaprenol L-rhamnosyltransferase